MNHRLYFRVNSIKRTSGYSTWDLLINAALGGLGLSFRSLTPTTDILLARLALTEFLVNSWCPIKPVKHLTSAGSQIQASVSFSPIQSAWFLFMHLIIFHLQRSDQRSWGCLNSQLILARPCMKQSQS